MSFTLDDLKEHWILMTCRFGGVKLSGFGREGSTVGMAEYQITKMVTLGGMGQPLQGS